MTKAKDVSFSVRNTMDRCQPKAVCFVNRLSKIINNLIDQYSRDRLTHTLIMYYCTNKK